MRFFSACIIPLVTSGQASSAFDLAGHEWQAPSDTDLRGPCPGLNTLANHGFLPRDGRDLTVESVIQAGLDGFNFSPDLLFAPAKFGLLTSTDTRYFTLDDLKLHQSFEHDASISREDWAIGDNKRFNETLFKTLANSNPGVDYYNATSAGQVQKLRLADSQARNPNNTNTINEFIIRTGESAFYLSAMGDPLTGVAPKEFVNIFFREERMPIEEGWTRPETQTSLDTMQSLINEIVEKSEWAPNNSSECPKFVVVSDSKGNTASF